ncbi:glycerophosphodiester phosphodiesterase [Brevibacillus ginsengisoli]|uniref:glycerophosphodiester phosphodiesterase n=1 Tax=Brevibacillus ginsengisoli TaxID=363854 RepID=UPI003CEC7474
MRNLCIAHRGWSGKAPENTLAAFELALRQPGVDGIELDVHLSKDGVPVVIHDFHLSRTTNGAGKIADSTFSQLQQLDAGSWFAPSFSSQRIPSLEQVLQMYKGSKLINIELKQIDNVYDGLEEQVVQFVHSYRMEEQVVITSFDHYSVQKVKQLAPHLKAGPILCGNPLLLEEQLQEMNADFLSIDCEFVTPRLVDKMRKSNTTIMGWTVNEPETMKELMNLSKEIWICTNHPDRLLAL